MLFFFRRIYDILLNDGYLVIYYLIDEKLAYEIDIATNLGVLKKTKWFFMPFDFFSKSISLIINLVINTKFKVMWRITKKLLHFVLLAFGSMVTTEDDLRFIVPSILYHYSWDISNLEVMNLQEKICAKID